MPENGQSRRIEERYWPCRKCRYNLWTGDDVWEDPCTCPECGETCTADDIAAAMSPNAAPAGRMWKTLVWVPVIPLFFVMYIPDSIANRLSPLHDIYTGFMIPTSIIWLFGMSLYRYRYVDTWSIRVRRSLGMMFTLLIACAAATLTIVVIWVITLALLGYHGD